MAKVLMLGQQTEMAHLMVQGASEIRTSAPKFNLRGLEKWKADNIKNYDAAVFGVSISESVHKLLQNPAIVELAREMNVRLPAYQFDTFCQSKATKIRPLIEKCREWGINADKLESFVEAVIKLTPDDIKSMDDWESFLAEHGIDSDWRSRLHYEKVLSLFLCTEEKNLTCLREYAAPVKAGEKPETLENYSVRWLSKCLNLWTLKGCLTDIVNTICAMLGADDPHQLNETQLVTLVSKFAESLSKESGGDVPNLSWLWLPDIVLMDAEGDDCVAWVLLRYVCGLKTLRTIIQLPCDGEFNVEKGGKRVPVAIDFAPLSLALGLNQNTIVFRDQDSKNGSALASFHSLS
jgi:hypothetical protein